MGLIGELLYLSGSLAERIGLHDALYSWSGQELTHKDFSFNESWVEVKTISRGRITVRISSMGSSLKARQTVSLLYIRLKK